MAIADWFTFNTSQVRGELPIIFPLNIVELEFIKIDIASIYSKILTDVIERSHGLDNEDQVSLLWDNCVMSESSDGLITLLSKAMADKKDLFLVYEKALNVLREATNEEARVILADYKSKGESAAGVFISFKNFVRSDMIKLYSALEYCTVSALNKSMHLSTAIQFKMNDLRGSTSLADSAEVKTQAIEIVKSLAKGKDILADAKDIIETAKPDLTSVKEAITFLNQKRSFYLGLPESYINGEQTGGLGTTGENDTKAIERGLKSYFFSIIKPVIKVLFEKDLTYKSQDFRQIAGSMDVLKTFSLIDDTLISAENKLKIINQLLDLPEDAEGDEAPAPEPIVMNEGQKFVTPPSKNGANA